MSPEEHDDDDDAKVTGISSSSFRKLPVGETVVRQIPSGEEPLFKCLGDEVMSTEAAPVMQWIGVGGMRENHTR
jgi:hypothetical protein